MPRITKAIVMWLIALTIPLQGMAAVAMPSCAPAHHGAAAERVSIAADDGHAHAHTHDHAMAGVAATAATAATANMATPHHAAANPMTAATQAHGAGSDKSSDAGHPMLKCCSAACAMAAVLPPSLPERLKLRSPAPLQPLAQFYRGVTPDGLDRPPKSILA